MAALVIETVPVEALQLHPDNPRRGDIDAIRRSITANGFYGALVAQRSTGHVLVGNHRLQAAIAEGFAEVPVHWLDCDDTTARRVLVADNRASDLAGYDERELALLLEELAGADSLAGALYEASDVAALLASSGLTGERESAFLDDLAEGASSAKSLSEGGELEAGEPTPRQLVIAASPEEREEIVAILNRLKERYELPTMTAALLWALRQADVTPDAEPVEAEIADE